MIAITFTPGDVLAILGWYLLWCLLISLLGPFVKAFGKGIFDAVRSRWAWRRHLRDVRQNKNESGYHG